MSYPEIYVNSAKKNFLAICDTFLLLSNSLSIRSEIHSKIISIFSKMVVYEWSRLHYNQDLLKIRILFEIILSFFTF